MKNKIHLFVNILAIFIIALLFSCQKFETKADNEIEQEIALKDVSFSPEFNWETSQIISLNIASTNSQILYITSTDQLIRYHKGIHPGNSSTYTVKISVPTNVKKLNINDIEFDLSSNNISLDL